jgi:hypothetical protein
LLVQEPGRLADRSEKCRGADQVHARHRHQPPDLRPGQRLLSDQLLDRGDLRVQERELSETRVNGLALLDRQLEISQPPAALHAE